MIDFPRSALVILYPNKISSIKKKPNRNYHIEYYLDLAKRDKKMKAILSKLDIQKIAENPSSIIFLHKVLNKLGIGVVLNVAPQTIEPTACFIACMPNHFTDFQREELEKYSKTDFQFLDFGIYNPQTDDYDSLIKPEDLLCSNAYLITEYIHTIEQADRERNNKNERK